MKRHELLKVPNKLCNQELIGFFIKWIERDIQSKDRADRPDLANCCRADLVLESMLLIIQYHLFDKDDNVRQWLPRLLDFSNDYFLGDWRNRISPKDGPKDLSNREFWDIYAMWKFQYPACLLAGACLGAWDQVKILAASLKNNVALDMDQSSSNRAWYLYVSGILCNRPKHELRSLFNEIQRGHSQRERLLLDMLDSILNRSDEDLASSLKKYFLYYKKTEFCRNDIPSKIAMDGTFLIHYGRHLGRNMNVTDNIRPHIIEVTT